MIMFEVIIIKRRRRWEWRVCDLAGTTIMWGWEETRDIARYRGNRALFLLLAANSQITNGSSQKS
jgi:hypothetical protein